MSADPKPSFSSGRRWLIGLNVLVASLAFLALVVMANYLASGYYRRFRLSQAGTMELAPQTVSLLKSVTNDLDVIIFFDRKGEEDLYQMVSGLLREYNFQNPKISVKSVDYTRYPGTAEIILAKYKLGSLKDKNFVIFDSGGRSKIVYANELSEYDLNKLMAGGTNEINRIGFKGEMMFSSAIYGLAFPRASKAYFLTGHGEHDPLDTTELRGYSKFAALLRDENNIEWEKLSLQGTNEIPSECQLLIVAAPANAHLLPGEIEKLEKYLKEGGRLLALFNYQMQPGGGLEKILAPWGVASLANAIDDPENSLGPGSNVLIPMHYDGQHPVMKTLAAKNLPIELLAPRTVGLARLPSQAANSPKVEVLAQTGAKAIARAKTTGPSPEVTEHVGPQPLMAAVEQGAIKGVTTEQRATRILVVGDSFFLGNQMLDSAANHYFAGFAVNWLVSRPQLLINGLGPKVVRDYRVVMTRAQLRTAQWLLLAGLPGTVLFIGGCVWLRRRR